MKQFNNVRTEVAKIFSLAWPLLIAQVTQMLMGVSDTIMAGRYNSVDMAAVAIGSAICFPMLMFVQGVCFALSPVVSRLNGANERTDVAFKVQQMLYLSVLLSLPLVAISFALEHVVALIDMSEPMAEKAVGYSRFVFWAAPAFAVYQCLRNYCEGLSLTRPTMLIMLCGLLVNIPANYVFINGLFGLPELGGAGCGVATAIVLYAMAIITVLYTRYNPQLTDIGLYNKRYKLNLSELLSFLKLGLPVSFTLIFEVMLFAMTAILIAPFGAQTVASHQIALNVSSLIFMLPMSIGIALAIRIGYLIGENRAGQTRTAYGAALILSIATVFVTATITVLFNTQIAQIYSKEADVITAAASLLLLASLFQFSDAIQVVSANALRGHKDTQAMLWLSFTAYWLVGFPVAVILGLTDLVVPKMAATGFWIGFIVGLSVAAVIMSWRVRKIQSTLANG